MQQAVEQGDVATVAALLAADPSLAHSCVASDGWSLLHLAVGNGHVDVIEQLLGYRASVESTNDRGWTPLHVAAECGHLAALNVLLSAASRQGDEEEDDGGVADAVNHGAQDGATPLYIACVLGRHEVAHALLQAGARAELATRLGWTPLLAAVGKGSLDTARLLLEAGADVGAAVEGESALHMAAEDGHVAMVELLVEYKAELDGKSGVGLTPLYLACAHGHDDVVRVLLQAGADMFVDCAGWTCVAVAAKKDHVRVLRQLFDAGGEDKRVFEPIERHNASPVFLAARFGSRRAVQLLLAHGADVDAANVLQQTPLDAAVGYGHTDIVLDLVQHGVDASAASTTAMFQAAKRGHADTLRLALDAGADATCSLDGESVLQFAVSKNQADVVRVLLDHGADRFRLGEGEGVGEGVGQGVRELLRSYFPYECEQMMQMFLGVVSSPQLSGYALLDMNAVALVQGFVTGRERGSTRATCRTAN